MSATNDGGPAFPQTLTFNQDGQAVTAGSYFAECSGMSIRDWFAGQALAGLMASPSLRKQVTYLEIASCAFKSADAMLAARGAK